MLSQLFDPTTNLLHRALDIRNVKHMAIASNIANQDTPEYKAKDLDFKKVIRDFLPMPIPGPLSATDRQHFISTVKLTQTNPRHLPLGGPVHSAEKYVFPSQDRTTRVDKNNVNPELEMAKLAENNLMFNASAQFISGKFTRLKDVIRDGR